MKIKSANAREIMIWKTTNALGQEVTWYSEDEYNTLLNALFDIQELLELCDNDTHIDRAMNRIDEVLYVNS